MTDGAKSRHGVFALFPWASLTSTLAPLGIFAATALTVLLVARLGLAWLYSARLGAAGGLAPILEVGLRFDLVIVAGICALSLLINILAPGAFLRSSAWLSIRTAWFMGWMMLLVFNEAATPAFMAEFGVRPNRQYVEYLNTPALVFSTIWNNNRTSLLVGIVLTVFAAALTWALLRRAPGPVRSPGVWLRLFVLLPGLVILGYTVRGSLGHRPLSVSTAALSTDATVNDLALNSTYSAFHALWQLQVERGDLSGYAVLPEAEVVARVRAGMQLPGSVFAEIGRAHV